MTILAKYNLESNSNDYSGNWNNWVDNAMSYSSWIVSNSAVLNGTSSYSTIPDVASLRPWTGDFMWKAFINTTAVATKIALAKGQILIWSGDYVSLITYNDWKVWLRISDWTTSPEPKSTAAYNNWKWHRVVWYRSWTTAYLYINWAFIASVWSAGINLDNIAPLVIWNFSYLNAALYYWWKIDEIEINDTAPTIAEIVNDNAFYRWLI